MHGRMMIGAMRFPRRSCCGAQGGETLRQDRGANEESMDLNRVTLIGNLTKDPVQKSFQNGKGVSSFSIATNYRWEDAATKESKENVEFHDVVAWGKLGDIIHQYVKKGSKVYVEGRLRNRTWKGRDGKAQKRTEIVADNLIMLGHRNRRDTAPDAAPA